jgi:diacylglycerol O-acyltransferase
MQQLSGMDASFVYFETPDTPMHVAGMSIYDPSTAPGGVVTFKGILDNIERRLHLSRVFRQKMVRVPMDWDHPFWVEDEDFDLEFHVRHIALPQPGDWRQLCIQAARIHARALDLNRPLWELYVIEGLNNVDGVPPGSFALLQKTHHAAVDGVSGMEIMSAINDLEPDTAPPEMDTSWKGERTPEPWELLARAGLNNAMRPWQFAEVLGRTMPGLQQVGQRLSRNELEAPAAEAPRTRFNGRVSPHRVIGARVVDLDLMKAVKSAVTGATINDGVLATVGGALRRYLESKGELPGPSLIAMAPISIRSDDQKGAAGNQVSGMNVLLGTDIVDPVKRLEAVRESTHKQKEFTSALGAQALSEYSQFLPGGLAALGARAASQMEMENQGNPPVNTVVTNVPGPQVPLYFAGARLVNLVGIGPVGTGMGLIHPITSYCGHLTIAFTSDREMLPDPAFYADCIQESFDELVRATI